MLAEKNADVKRAVTIIRRLSGSERERRLADMEELARMDEVVNRRAAYNEGRTEGRTEGKAEGKFEILSLMFAAKIPDGQIWAVAQSSGITREDYESFRDADSTQRSIGGTII
jgi:predicted transposase/invertase (TIGR01784 family)